MRQLHFAVAALALVAIFAASPTLAQSDSRVAQLIAASGKAVGASALPSISTIRFDERISAVGLKGTVVQYVDLRDGRFAETTNLAPLLSLDGYDGKVEWTGDDTHLVWTQGGDSERSAELNQSYLESYGLWRPNAGGADTAWLGTKTVGDKSYDGLRITPPDSKVPFELWFDRTTHLPARGTFVNGFTTSTIAFSDYRPVGGLNIAHVVHVDSSDGNNSDITVEKVTFNPADAETALARPQTQPTD